MWTAITILRVLADWRTAIGNIRVRWRERSTRAAVEHAPIDCLLPNGPPRYRITQTAKVWKARRTWERSMRVYLAQRRAS